GATATCQQALARGLEKQQGPGEVGIEHRRKAMRITLELLARRKQSSSHHHQVEPPQLSLSGGKRGLELRPRWVATIEQVTRHTDDRLHRSSRGQVGGGKRKLL